MLSKDLRRIRYFHIFGLDVALGKGNRHRANDCLDIVCVNLCEKKYRSIDNASRVMPFSLNNHGGTYLQVDYRAHTERKPLSVGRGTYLQVDYRAHTERKPLSVGRLFFRSCNEHYANTPMQIYWIFSQPKNWNFSDKNSYIFHISAQNKDCGYSLEPPHRGGSNKYPQSMVLNINEKKMYTPVNPFLLYKSGV